MHMLLDPVGLFGEGQYNLHSLKEISVTDSFMGLNIDTRKCQNIETYDRCSTRLLLETLKQECGCLPIAIKLAEEVEYYRSEILFQDFTQDALCMTDREIECSQTITIENSTSCLR